MAWLLSKSMISSRTICDTVTVLDLAKILPRENYHDASDEGTDERTGVATKRQLAAIGPIGAAASGFKSLTVARIYP